jgi:hypothetical protein
VVRHRLAARVVTLQELAALAVQAAQRHGVDPRWFRSMVGAESAGNPNAVSPKGAMGLGQLMPGTAREMGVTNPYDPAQNLDGSAGYFRKMLDQFGGQYPQATAAYNWGPGNLQRAGGSLAAIPSETQKYLARVSASAGAPMQTPSAPSRWTDPNAILAMVPPTQAPAEAAPAPAPTADSLPAMIAAMAAPAEDDARQKAKAKKSLATFGETT